MSEPNAIGPTTRTAPQPSSPGEQPVKLDLSGLGTVRRTVIFTEEELKRAREAATPPPRPLPGVFTYRVSAPKPGAQPVAGRVGNAAITPAAKLPDNLGGTITAAAPGLTLRGRVDVQITSNANGEVTVNVGCGGMKFKTHDGRGGTMWMEIPDSQKQRIAEAVKNQLQQSGMPTDGNYSITLLN